MLKIAILGCGYIGLQLAKTFSKKKVFITGTTRSEVKIKQLQQFCQKAVILDSKNYEDIRLIVQNHDVIIVTISISRKEDYQAAFKKTAQNIRKAALEVNSPKKLIYTSSTLVYGDHLGHWVDESSALQTILSQGKILIATEKLFSSLQNLGWSVLLLRLGEIYGPERELSKKVKAYQSKLLPGSGLEFTNMVHKDDIINAIQYGLRHELNGIYNLVDDDHPTRKDLFDLVAKQYNSKTPQWDPNISTMKYGNKRVSNHNIKAAGYELIYPHRLII